MLIHLFSTFSKYKACFDCIFEKARNREENKTTREHRRTDNDSRKCPRKMIARRVWLQFLIIN